MGLHYVEGHIEDGEQSENKTAGDLSTWILELMLLCV